MKAVVAISVLLCVGTAVLSGSLEAQVANHVVISEVLINGTGSAELDEFIELHNPTSSDISLAGDTLFTQNATGGSVHAYSLTGTVPAHGFYLLTDSISSVTGDFRDAKMSLTNSGGSVFLRNGTVVDAVGWGTSPSVVEGSPLTGSPAELSTYERKAQSSSSAASMSPGGSDESLGNGWDSGSNNADLVLRPAGTGEPQNSASPAETPAPGNQPPVISSIARAVFLPPAGSTDSVYATITDPEGTVAQAKLHVRANGGPYDSSWIMSLVSGSRYAAVIPAAKNASNGDLVEYFVSATDDSSASAASALQGYFVGDVTIANIKTRPASAVAGYGAQVNGTINVNTNVLRNGGTFVQDGTGGIHLFQPGIPALDAGRNARVQGELNTFHGGYELSGTHLKFVDTTGTTTLTPVIVSLPVTSQSASYANEGRLVKILSLTTDSSGAFAASRPYKYKNASNDTITVFVQSNGTANTLVGTPIPAGSVDAVGILQFAEDFLELTPRRAEDMGVLPPVTYEAVSTGNWSDSLTWSGHHVPTASDDVTMTTLGVTVTIDLNNAQCRDLTITGTGNAPNSGPLLQFNSTGPAKLTVNGRLSVSGGSGGGGGDRGGRAKLSSNGNASCVLAVKGTIVSTPSNSAGNGNAGVNMNEGTVQLLGASSDSLRNGASVRLGNLEIGDGSSMKTFRCAPTAGGATTIYLRSLRVNAGSTFWIGSDASSHPPTLGDGNNDTLPHLSGGIVVEDGANFLVQDFSGGVNVADINLDGGGIVNNGTIRLYAGGANVLPSAGYPHASPEKAASGCNYTLRVGVNGGLPPLNQIVSGSQVGQFANITVGANDTLTLLQDMNLPPSYKMTLNGTLQETAGNTVIGALEARRFLAQADTGRFGGAGVTVYTADVAPETTTVTRVTGAAQNGGGNSSILRYVDITPGVNNGLHAALEFSYDESELNDRTESTLQLWKSADGGNTWNAAAGTLNTENNSITAAGVNSFSRWTASDTSHPLGEASKQYLFAPGWNVISVPLRVADYRKSALFPDAASSAFAYAGSYIVRETLANAAGYWLKFPALDTVTMSGTELALDTIPVVEGWNLIGSIGAAVNAAAIGQIPDGLVLSSYFAYDGAYVVSDAILPSKGYWVKVNGNGKLVLSGPVSAPKRSSSAQDPAKNFNTLTITDNSGNTQTLRFGPDVDGTFPLANYEMPPLPPPGGFDARFASQHLAAAYPAGSDELRRYPIELHPTAFPVTVHWHVVTRDNVFRLTDESNNSQSLTGDGRISLTGAATLTLTVSGRELPPATFTLGANYPNPFNPSTRFTVTVPVRSPVNITVYDVLGRTVATLVDDLLTAGYHTVEWNGRAENGQEASGAVYFVRMTSGNFVAVRKIVMLK